MTIQELRNKYFFHDSCIMEIKYDKKNQNLLIMMDFCQWAQDWYNNNDPENVCLKLTFKGITDYNGLEGKIDYYSILDAEIKENKLWFNVLDDIHNETYEIWLAPAEVIVENLGAVIVEQHNKLMVEA